MQNPGMFRPFIDTSSTLLPILVFTTTDNYHAPPRPYFLSSLSQICLFFFSPIFNHISFLDKIFWSSLAIDGLIKGINEGSVTLNIQPDGSFDLTLSHLNENPHEAKVEFIKDGTIAKAQAYERGLTNAKIEASGDLTKMHKQITNYKLLVQQKIDTVQASYGPDIQPDMRSKIDHVLTKLDSVSTTPGLARFGQTCAKERALLDRCYIANQEATIFCQDYAKAFNQCVYATPEGSKEIVAKDAGSI